MALIGTVTNAGFSAMSKGFAGVVAGGSPVRNIASYFIVGEGGSAVQTISSETLGAGNGTTTTFNFVLVNGPVQRGTLIVTMTDGRILTDNGNGQLISTAPLNSSGTIDYKGGAVKLIFTVAPANADAMVASYSYFGAPKTPNPSYVQLEAQASPLSPTNSAHLAWYKKAFATDINTFVQQLDTPTPHVDMHCFLDLPEFLDDGRGASPIISEIGIFDSEDVMIVYCTLTGQKKTSATQFNRTVTINW